MEFIYYTHQNFLAYSFSLLICSCLQSCNNWNNIELGTIKEPSKQVDIKSMVNKKLMVQGGHVVAFQETAGHVQAIIKENCPQGLHKTHTLPVYVAQGTSLQDGGEPIKAHLILPTSKQEGYVWIGSTGLKGGGNTNAKLQPNFTLRSAIIDGKAEAVRLFLQQGSDVNARDNHGNSPLHVAISYGRVGIVRLLLEEGAEVNIRDNNGVPLLHQAILKGNTEILNLLLGQICNLNITDEDGCAALHIAACNHHGEIVRKLLKKGADIDMPNKEGNTPLHLAAWCGDLEMVNLLIEEGANIYLKNKQGHSPLGIAFGQDNFQIVGRLLRQGAVPDTYI